MTTTRTLLTLLAVLTCTTALSAQQFERLVARDSYGRVVDLRSNGYNSSRYQGRQYNPYGSNPYGVAPVSYNPTYGNAAAYAPTLPVGNRFIRAGGCYAGPAYGGGSNYPVAYNYAGNPGNYPYGTASGTYGYGNRDSYVSRNVFGQPTRFDRDEPVRNIFRWLLP